MNDRNETLTERISTIVQDGYRDKKTSDDVAREIIRFMALWLEGMA